MNLFDFVKERIPILDVINQTVRLKSAGSYWKGPCPFHAEKDASFTVSPDKQIFYCFGCHAAGDVVGFMAKMENINQREAALLLVDRFNLNVPQEILTPFMSEEQHKARAGKERYYHMCRLISAWLHHQLLENRQAIQYLLDRGLTMQSIKHFAIGYFPVGAHNFSNLIKGLSAQNFLVQDLLDYGFATQNKNMIGSPFENRIIFPISTSLGEICGFGGRVWQPGDNRPKYYNSKDSDGFDKGKILFGFDVAKKALQEAGVAFLVEGYMDCVAMVQYRYPNTVATLGTACTVDHLKQLARHVHTLMVLYDGDQAGQKAMLRLTELCWQVNLELKIISLPKGHDPASFLIGGQDLKPFIDQARDIVTFFIDATGSDFSQKPLAQKLAATEKIAALIAKVDNTIKQDLLVQHTASLTDLPFASIRQLVKQASAAYASAGMAQGRAGLEEDADRADAAESLTDISLLEECMFSAIMNGLKTGNLVVIPSHLRTYVSEHLEILIKLCDDMVLQGFDQEHVESALFENLGEDAKEWVIKVVMRHDGMHWQQHLDKLLTLFCKYHWQRITKDIKQAIVEAKQNNDKQKVQDMVHLFAHLKKDILHRGLM